MNSRTRVLRAGAWLTLLTAIGTVGFVLLEDLSWLHGMYLTVTTVTTVGYGDFVPVTWGGQLFAIALVISGVGTALYLVSVIAEELLEGRIRDLYQRSSMMRKIEGRANHLIVCGYGRFGRVVVDELRVARPNLVVIEADATLEAELVEAQLDYIIGSATSDDVLRKAGVERAEVLVVATSSKSDGVFITLSARDLNPKIRIHARGESEGSIRRLHRAGADFVNSPYQTGGIRMAASILRPSVVDFLELSRAERGEEIDLEEVRAEAGSEIVGCEVQEIEAQNSRLRIIALKQHDRQIELVPKPVQRVQVGDHLVIIGEREQLSRLARSALGNPTR